MDSRGIVGDIKGKEDVLIRSGRRAQNFVTILTMGMHVHKSSSLSLNQRSFARFGAKLWNSFRDKFRQLPKSA